jgi:Ala-tRNA(Pro) deacylase
METSLESWLKNNKISYKLYTHPAVFTVHEAKIHCGHIPGTHCKNLFLIDKKTETYFLVTIPHEKGLDLKKFRKLVRAPKIRFVDPENLWNILKITPGAVSPIGLVNDKENRTIFYVDLNVWNAKEVCCHPNINTETLQLSKENFQKLIIATGNKIEIAELPFLIDSESLN